MVSTKQAAAAALAAGVLFGGAQAQAATDLEFCNKTGSKVFVALIHLAESNNKWMLNAWHTLNPGACHTVGKVRTGLFYYYAEKEGRKIRWPGDAYIDKRYCVPDSRVNRVVEGGACPLGERLVGFRGLTPSTAKYTFTLS